MSIDANFDPIVIIGAGPTGTALAIDLALRNTPSILVERYDEPQQIPKGQNLTQRTGEHFKSWGICNEIRQATLIPPEYGNEGMVAYGSLLSEYHYDWFKRATVREYYAADNERLPQFETERILRERAAQFDCIEIHKGWTYQSHEESGDRLFVKLKRTNGEDLKEIQASYLVGCDGARSRVRESAKITQSSSDTQRRMALLVFHSQQLHEILDSRYPGKTIFNALHPVHQGYWQFFGRVDLNANWFFHSPVPNDAVLDDYDYKKLLYEAVGTEFDFTLNHNAFWDLRFTHADTYRSGRTFISGDAAHSHPPYGGYGVNTGFEDARNLAWKLAARMHGWGTDALLDSYTSERHPVFASTRDDFILAMINSDARFLSEYSPHNDKEAFTKAWQQRATKGQSGVAGFVPHYRGSPIVQAEAALDDELITPGAKAPHSHTPEAGTHLSPRLFGKEAIDFDKLSRDFTLLLPTGDEAIQQQFNRAAATLGIPLTCLTQDEFYENNSIDSAESTSLPDPCVLVRPDHFIGWVEQVTDRESILNSDGADRILARCVASDL
jgi:2-polyprenyl-6-methoxyphenol hydroxylase-like FAD-dependent oxidoreductase